MSRQIFQPIHVKQVSRAALCQQELVAAEVAEGFVAPVPGGLLALRQQFGQVAVGKLGVVLAEGRSPRLVVDSSVSNVTANTSIPNHMLLPKISDLMDSAPREFPVDSSSSYSGCI